MRKAVIAAVAALAIAAVAALAIAPFTASIGVAHADWPACQSVPAGSGHDSCEQVCAQPGASGCGTPGSSSCVGSAVACADQLALCAEGKGPCPAGMSYNLQGRKQ
jgi:hypothetical protein